MSTLLLLSGCGGGASSSDDDSASFNVHGRLTRPSEGSTETDLGDVEFEEATATSSATAAPSLEPWMIFVCAM